MNFLQEHQEKSKKIQVLNNMSLVANIRRRQKLGISRPKSKSTVSAKAYKQMKQGWKKKSG